MITQLLKKILPPKEETFFTLFEESAEVCDEISKNFHKIVNEGPNEERSHTAKDLKHKSNAIVKKTLMLLNTSFITPIDREDIIHLASLLNKISRKIVKASLNLEIYRLETHTSLMKSQAETLIKSTEELKHTVSLLRDVTCLKEITLSNSKMKEIETKGDEILRKALEDVFSGNHDAMTSIKLKELYKNIESTMDACFDVSDIVVNIAVKHG